MEPVILPCVRPCVLIGTIGRVHPDGVDIMTNEVVRSGDTLSLGSPAGEDGRVYLHEQLFGDGRRTGVVNIKTRVTSMLAPGAQVFRRL